MLELIQGRYDAPRVSISESTFRAANNDVFEGLKMPGRGRALSLAIAPKEAIAERLAADAVSTMQHAFHGDFKGALGSLTKATAGALGMITGAMVGTALGGSVGAIVGMTLGGTAFQLAAEWLAHRFA